MKTFKEVTDELFESGFSADAVGAAVGVSGNTILRARRSFGQVRPEPRGWRPAFAALASERAAALSALAAELADA